MKPILLLFICCVVSVSTSTAASRPSRTVNATSAREGAMRMLDSTSGAKVEQQIDPNEPDPFADKKAAKLRDAKGALLATGRTRDPLGVEMRGSFKANASKEEEQRRLTDAQSPSQAPALPTFAQAVKNLQVGAINIETREILVESRTVAEGDIIIISNGPLRFSAWVESVKEDGVIFRDYNKGTAASKSLRTRPVEPGTSGVPATLEDFLRENPSN